MIRRYLTNAQWERIEKLCPGKEGDKGRHGEDNRRFIEAVLWINRTGVQIPVNRGQSFRRIADSVPVIADSL